MSSVAAPYSLVVFFLSCDVLQVRNKSILHAWPQLEFMYKNDKIQSLKKWAELKVLCPTR